MDDQVKEMLNFLVKGQRVKFISGLTDNPNLIHTVFKDGPYEGHNFLTVAATKSSALLKPMVQYLVNKHPELLKHTVEGKTALDLAKENNLKDIIPLMEEATKQLAEKVSARPAPMTFGPRTHATPGTLQPTAPENTSKPRLGH